MSDFDPFAPRDAEEDAKVQAEIDRLLNDSLKIQIPKLVAICLVAEGVADDRTPEYIAVGVLKKWAEAKHQGAVGLSEALVRIRRERDGSIPSARERNEHEFEGELTAELQARGLIAKTQINTGAGDADIVIYDGDKPIGVIEVKLELEGWRAAHQAFGQAQAYAVALGARHAWVTAPRLNRRLLTRKAPHILEFETAAETIHKRLGGPHVVSVADGA